MPAGVRDPCHERYSPSATRKLSRQRPVSSVSSSIWLSANGNGSVQRRTRSGLPAASYVAEHTLRGWKLTEYDTCVAAGSDAYIFVFVVGREEFESQVKAIQSVLDSFKLGN